MTPLRSNLKSTRAFGLFSLAVKNPSKTSGYLWQFWVIIKLIERTTKQYGKPMAMPGTSFGGRLCGHLMKLYAEMTEVKK